MSSNTYRKQILATSCRRAFLQFVDDSAQCFGSQFGKRKSFRRGRNKITIVRRARPTERGRCRSRLRETGNGPQTKEVLRYKFQPSLPCSSDDLNGEDRIATQFKKVVLHSHPLQPQHLCPNPT